MKNTFKSYKDAYSFIKADYCNIGLLILMY